MANCNIENACPPSCSPEKTIDLRNALIEVGGEIADSRADTQPFVAREAVGLDTIRVRQRSLRDVGRHVNLSFETGRVGHETNL